MTGYRFAVCGSFVVVLAFTVAAQERRPGGPPPEIRARIDAFVEAYNSGSAEQFEAMAKANMTPELFAMSSAAERAKAYRELRGELGTITIGRVNRRGPSAPLELMANGSTGVQATIALEIEAASPFRISSIDIEIGGDKGADPKSGPAVNARMSKEELAQTLDAYLSKLAAADAFSGVALVARDGIPVFERAYGFADRSNKVPNTTRTRFSLGSINKSFTQLAIAQLAAAGKLAYSDTLGKLIPDYPQAQSRAATIEQLLTHTGGVADFFGDDFASLPKDRFRSNEDYYRYVSSKPPLFAPGARTQYCNGCYITLGAIIQRVAGMPYEEYVARHIFKPAGMSTSFPQADAIEPDIAHGYTRRTRDGQLRSSVYMRGAAGSAAGSAYATAADLLAYDNALRELRIADEASTSRILGFPATRGARAKGGYAIAGGAPGTSAVLESNGTWTVIVLTNYDPPAGEQTGVAIMRALDRP